MKDILEYIVGQLVTKKESINIKEEVDGNFIRYVIQVDKEDFGKVIGHEGKIAKSIRAVMGAIATVKNVKVVVDIRW